LIDKSTQCADSVVPVGRAVPGSQVLILDEAGEPCSTGCDGRIAVRSGYLAMGYWRQPQLTAAAFRAVADQPGIRQFMTGDLGHLRTDGCLEHRGRIDHQVKIRGWRVDTGAVEAALLATGRVAEAAVVAKKDADGESRLVAYVVPRCEEDRGAVVSRHVLQDALPASMIPETFVELPVLPQTPSGKIDRSSLSTLPTSPADRRPQGRTPRDRIEKKVAAIWEAVLDIHGVGLDDDFFDLGGDSLRTVDVLLRVEEAFSISLSPLSLVEHPLLGDFAAAIAQGSVAKTSSPLIALRPTGSRPPLFLVHPGNGSPACFGPVARLMHPEQPVYAFRAPGMHGECRALTSIRAMAKRYVREVLAVRPDGPYLLGGRCMGGLIAMEMARQLEHKGKCAAMVAMFDTPYPSRRHGRMDWRRRFTDGVRDVIRMMRWSFLQAMGLTRRPAWLPAYRHFVGQMTARAVRAYRPGAYDGDLALFIASDQPPARKQELMKMTGCAHQAHVISIPGDHAGMLRRPAVDHLAQQLQIRLDAVIRD